MANLESELHYRLPDSADGSEMWRMVKESGKLDLNSPYYYMIMSDSFSDTCRLAEDTETGRLIGMVTGFRQPSDSSRLFVWQIAIDEKYKGRGIALKLLDALTESPDIRFIEATISPSNLSSRRLFEKWAARRRAPIVVSSGFSEESFPDQKHEREDLYRIGPFE